MTLNLTRFNTNILLFQIIWYTMLFPIMKDMFRRSFNRSALKNDEKNWSETKKCGDYKALFLQDTHLYQKEVKINAWKVSLKIWLIWIMKSQFNTKHLFWQNSRALPFICSVSKHLAIFIFKIFLLITSHIERPLQAILNCIITMMKVSNYFNSKCKD